LGRSSGNLFHHGQGLIAKIPHQQHQIHLQMVKGDRVLGLPLVMDIADDGNPNAPFLTGHGFLQSKLSLAYWPTHPPFPRMGEASMLFKTRLTH
jgi:hypothetical protein